MVSTECRVEMTDHARCVEVDQECILINLKTNLLFGLDETGTRAWSLLGQGLTIQEAARLMADEYEATEEEIRCDLTALVEQLAEKGLVVCPKGER